MKYTVRVSKANGYDNYDKVMHYFSMQFFHSQFEDKARGFYEKLGEYLDTTKFPCDKMILDCFIGYADRFGIVMQYNEEKIAWLELQVKSYNRIVIHHCTYYKEDFKCFNHILEDYFNGINNKIMSDILSVLKEKCNIQDNCANKIMVQKYVDYNPKEGETISLVGSLSEIFDRFTTMNDRLRYCNGNYYKFLNENIEKLYQVFVAAYNGNYFLDNAVKRGTLID